MKNAPAVTARRATNQIVLVAEHQALVVTAAATAAATPAVIVLAEQTVRVVTMRLIDHAVMAHRLIDRAGMDRHLIDLVVTAQPARLALLEIAPIRLDRNATVIRVLVGTATIALVFPAATAIPVRPEPVAVTAPTVLVRVVTATRAHVARATALVGHRVRRPIDRILRALRGMAIRVHDARVTDRILRARRGMAIRVLVGTATAPIPHAHRVTVRVQTVLEATVQTVLAQTGRAAFDPTAIDLAATGSPRAVNDVRSARR